jgi:hypothetical protein
VPGGLRTAEYHDFLFGCSSAIVPSPRRPKLLGGQPDDTGGSAFEVPYSFVGDSSRAFLVLYCSFVDGIDRGIQLPLLYTLKTNFHLSQIAASAAIGVSLSPWLFKPVLALITDTIPILGYRRKPYIFGAATINAVSLGLIAYCSLHHFGGVLIPMTLMTLRTFGRAMIDAAAQGLLLEDCRGPSGTENDQSKTSVLVSRFQAAHRLGQFLNVLASGYLMSTQSITPVYVSMAAAHVGTMVLSWATEEDRVDPLPLSSSSSNVDELLAKYDELKVAIAATPAFTNVLEYAFLSVAVPSYETPMAYYLIDARHFSITSMSLVNIVQTTGSLIAPIIYSEFFQRSKYSSLMIGLTVASIPASLIPLVITTGLASSYGLNEVALAAFGAFTLTVVNDLQMLPANVLIAQLAPKGLEGTSFSLLTVVEGTGRVVSNVISAILPYGVGAVAPRYSNMSLYVVVCTVFNVGPFSAIEGFDDIGSHPQIEEEDQGGPLPANVAAQSSSLGSVMKQLHDDMSISPVSSESEMSPARQLPILPMRPDSPNQ